MTTPATLPDVNVVIPAQITPPTLPPGDNAVARPQSTTSRKGNKNKKSIGFYKHTRDTLASLEVNLLELTVKVAALSGRDSAGQHNDNAEFKELHNICEKQAARIKALEDSAAKE